MPKKLESMRDRQKTKEKSNLRLGDRQARVDTLRAELDVLNDNIKALELALKDAGPNQPNEELRKQLKIKEDKRTELLKQHADAVGGRDAEFERLKKK